MSMRTAQLPVAHRLGTIKQHATPTAITDGNSLIFEAKLTLYNARIPELQLLMLDALESEGPSWPQGVRPMKQRRGRGCSVPASRAFVETSKQGQHELRNMVS